MRRPHPGFSIGLAASTLLLALVVYVDFHADLFASARARGDVAGLPLALAALPGLLLVAATGRVLLALLPPGPLGSHAPADLPTTWAVSHLLGSFAIAVEMVLLPPRAGAGYVFVLLVPWAILGVLRIVTLPGAMVPRREPRAEPAGRGARVLGGLFALVMLGIPLATLFVFGAGPGVATTLAPAFDPAHVLPAAGSAGAAVPRRSHLLPGGPETLLALTSSGAGWRLYVPVTVVSLLVIAAHGLRQARRAPAGRRAALLILALALAPLAVAGCDLRGEAFLRATGMGAGAALGIGWLRRADRRSLVLASVGFGVCALAGGPRLALGGWVGLVVATAAPSRMRALVAAVAYAAVAGLAVWRAMALDPRVRLGWGPHPADTPLGLEAIAPIHWFVAPAFLCAAIWLVYVARRDPRRPPQPGEADEPSREWIALGVPLVLALAASPWLTHASTDLPTMLLPLAGLFTALVLVRPERG